MAKALRMSVIVVVGWIGHLALAATKSASVASDGLKCAVEGATLVSILGPDGRVYADAHGAPRVGGVRTLKRRVGFDKTEPQPAFRTGTRLAKTRLREADATLETTYRVDAETGDLIITQHGVAADGLVSVQWGVSGIPLDFNIVAPVLGGVKYTRRTPLGKVTWRYPFRWGAQFVIVEGKQGGLLIWAKDAKPWFKRIHIQKGRDGWTLAFETENFAPFDDKGSLETPEWHVTRYEGDWRVAAGRYRNWVTNALDYEQWSRRQPAWTRDVRLVVFSPWPDWGGDRILEPLAKQCDPKQTLLYLPTWRRERFDHNYPDYTPRSPKLKQFVAQAHRFGFKVMLHTNVFGCDPKNDAWAQLKPYQWVDPFTGRPTFADIPAQGVHFALIHLGAKRWREMFISRMKTLHERFGIDALHLDQLVMLKNVGPGVVDGMTLAEGAQALLRELRVALPDVAIGSECLNEVICPYVSFAQWFAPGMGKNGWSQAHIDTAHPVAVYVFRPFTIPYAHLRFPRPSQDQFFAAFTECYSHFGAIPTLAYPHPALLSRPATGWLRQLLDEARFFQRRRVTPNLDAKWSPDTIFAFRTGDGAPVRRLRQDGSTVLKLLGPRPRVLSRTIHGVRKFRCRGMVWGALAYDADYVFGLCPDRRYPCFDDEPRDLGAFHLVGLPQKVCIADVLRFKGGVRFELAPLSHAEPRDANARGEFRVSCAPPFVLSARSGRPELTRSDDGAWVVRALLPNTFYAFSPPPQPVSLPARLTKTPFGFVFYEFGDNRTPASYFGDPRVERVKVGGVTKDGIFAHPPTGGGRTVVQFPLTLPGAPTRFKSFVGLKDGSRSDGCIFIVKVNGVEAARRKITPGRWAAIRADLARWAGQPVLLTLTTDAAGSAS